METASRPYSPTGVAEQWTYCKAIPLPLSGPLPNAVSCDSDESRSPPLRKPSSSWSNTKLSKALSDPGRLQVHSQALLKEDNLPQNMAGFLKKKGRRTSYAKVRYVTLNGDVLACCHTEYSSPGWRVQVSDCTVRKDGLSITLHLTKRGDITFFADDELTAFQWFRALENAKRRSQERFFSVHTRHNDVYREN